MAELEEKDYRSVESLLAIIDEYKAEVKRLRTERDEARMKALEEACKAVCGFCKDGNWSLTHNEFGDYEHLQIGKSFTVGCAANGIRRLMVEKGGAG